MAISSLFYNLIGFIYLKKRLVNPEIPHQVKAIRESHQVTVSSVYFFYEELCLRVQSVEVRFISRGPARPVDLHPTEANK
jgi:hypothetical protein